MADPSFPSGVYYLPPRRGAEGARQVDASTCANATCLLAEIGRQLAFPDWYGSNFDALHDCLSDPDCLPDGRLLISGLDSVAAASPDDFTILMDVLASVTEVRRAIGSPLIVLVDTAAAALPALPAE